ncbi:transmembrane protein 108 [Tiliqua scincoides]|uniref:transmembrane protein 108 n=1 Tax=Tiliqua scincoides TaxID=71010 RepID=UPI0034623D88
MAATASSAPRTTAAVFWEEGDCHPLPPSILLILALTEEVAFAVQAPPPSLASPLGLLTDSINTISAMGTTPQQKGRRMSKLSTTATLASFRLTSSVTTFSPAMDQETPTSSHLVGIKEPYHLYNQSALFSGKTRPKGNVFQIVKGGFTEFADPYLKTELHSPPTLRNWSPSQPLQPQPSSHSNDHSTVLVSTTVTSLHSETLESLNTAVKGSSLEQVTQEMDITTSVTGPSTAPEIVTVPFKPPHYGIWDIPGKNNSWVASRQSTDQIPFFASPGTATTASALGHSNQPGVDTGVPLHVTGNPNGTSSTMHPSGDDANFPSSTLSTEPSTWLPSSTSTATGNFLNRLVPAGTRKPGHPGNISHVTEGDKPQHRATICLSKVDIAWIILAISVPISSCSVLLTVCCMRRKKKTSNPENNLSYWNNAITMDYFNRHAVELPREIQSLETSEDHLSEPRSPANGDYRDTGMVLVNPFCQETLFVGHEQVSEI